MSERRGVNMIEINLFELLICIALASFGGIVKRIVDMEKHPKKKVKPGQYVTSAITSLFVGIVMYSICKNYNIAPFMIISLVSVAGFLGAPIINIIASFSLGHLKFVNKDSIDDLINDKPKNKETN